MRRELLDRSGRRPRAGWICALILVTAGCGHRQPPRPTPPPPTVTVIRAERRDVPIEVEAIGTTRAFHEVLIRARVAGFLSQKLFEDGSNVEAVPPDVIRKVQNDLIAKIENDTYDPRRDAARAEDRYHPLLVIDEAPLVVAVRAAIANLMSAQAKFEQARRSKAVETATAQQEVSRAQRDLARIQYDRYEGLYRRSAVTREEFQEQQAALAQAEADLAAKAAATSQAKVDYESNLHAAEAAVKKAEADLDQAKLDLSYCRMYAPIDGRIGELQVKLGNYVAGSAEKTPLVSIQQLDPMGVDFRPSARYLSRVAEMVEEHLPVRLIVGDQPFPHPGRLVFSDNTVEPTTSTFLLRAEVPNPEGALLPGVYLKTFTVIGQYKGVLVVPERAVVETQNGPTVFVVNERGEADRVEIDAIDSYQGLRVLGGAKLKPGQLVLVDGLQLIRPGMRVKAEIKPLADVLPRPIQAGIPTRAERLNSPLAQLFSAGETDATPKDTPAPAPKPEPSR